MSTAPSESVQAAARPGASVSRAWLRALDLTGRIDRTPERVLLDVVGEHAAARPDAWALVAEEGRLTYRDLAERARRYGRWALAQAWARARPSP